MKFIDQRTGETKEAVSLTIKDGKVYIQFEEGGKVINARKKQKF